MCAASFLKLNVMQHSRKKNIYPANNVYTVISILCCHCPKNTRSLVKPRISGLQFHLLLLGLFQSIFCWIWSSLSKLLKKKRVIFGVIWLTLWRNGRANQWRLYKSPPIRKILWVQLGSEALKIHEIHFHGVSFSGYLLQQPRGSCSLMVNLSGLPFPGNLIRKGNLTSGSVLIILATSIIPSG